MNQERSAMRPAFSCQAQFRQHTAMIFLAFLGGIWLFGIPGLILGPVLFSVAGSLLTIWHARNHTHKLASGTWRQLLPA